MTRIRRVLLTLSPLEDRTTPAAYSYAGGTLTVTPETGDAISVALSGFNVPGFLHVATPASSFDSGGDRPVRNLVVKGSAAANYTLTLLPNVWLTNLTVTGASGATMVNLGLDVRISGNFRFDGHPAGGDDTLFLGGFIIGQGQYGGNVTVNLRGGTNLVDIGAGSIGGSLNISGGEGNDTVNLVALRPLMVGRDVNFDLGDGGNEVRGLAAFRFAVGRNFNFTGGAGDDQINFGVTPVVIGGSVNLNLRTPPMVVLLNSDSWLSDDLTIGRNFTARGGLGAHLLGPNLIGGNVSVSPSASGGSLDIGHSMIAGMNVATSAIGGSINFQGTAGDDYVSLDHVTIERNVLLNLGPTPIPQLVKIGTTQVGAVYINGSLTIRGDISDVHLIRTHIGGSTKLFLGDFAELVVVDDCDFSGSALFNLGAGGDNLSIDTQTNDLFLGVPLGARTRFQSSLTVDAGDGVDAVFLGTIAGGTGVDIGGPIRLFGGADNDNLTLLAGNVYLNAIRSEDFELGDNF